MDRERKEIIHSTGKYCNQYVKTDKLRYLIDMILLVVLRERRKRNEFMENVAFIRSFLIVYLILRNC